MPASASPQVAAHERLSVVIIGSGFAGLCIGIKLKGQAWVDWMMERWVEMQRISRGAVVMVVEGRTRNYRYSGTPLLLGADLIRAGFVDVLLAGNALAVHDVEFALSGTSLGIDLAAGAPVEQGHRNHMAAINTINRALKGE